MERKKPPPLKKLGNKTTFFRSRFRESGRSKLTLCLHWMPGIKDRNNSENISNWSLWRAISSFRVFHFLLRLYFSLVFLYKKSWKCWTFLNFLIKPSELQVQTVYSIAQKVPLSQNHTFHSPRQTSETIRLVRWMVRISWKWWGFLKMLCFSENVWWLRHKGFSTKIKQIHKIYKKFPKAKTL